MIIGDDEVHDNTVTIKDTKDKTQYIAKIDELIDSLDELTGEEELEDYE